MKLNKFIHYCSSITLLFSFIYAGSLSGNVKYDGKPPKKRKLRMNADPVCGASHTEPVFSENFKMGKDGSMEEALVYLKKVEYTGGIPSEPAVLDQKGCIYTPHVFGIQAGQELLIKNSDATLHNIHSMPKKNKEFNFAMPKVVKTKKSKFDTTFIASGESEKSKNETVSTTSTGSTKKVNSTQNIQAGFKRKILSGAELSMLFDWDREGTNSKNNLFDPNFSTGLTLSVTQPLLRNYGVDLNSADIRIATENLRQSRNEYNKTFN